MAQITVEAPEGEGVPLELVEAGLRLLLDREGVPEAEITVVFLPDEPILELNRTFLHHDWVPDVLAFPLHEEEGAPVGDVYVGLEQGRRQAEEWGVPLVEEWVRLALHGGLHLLGYDHPEDPEARAASVMYRLQEELVRATLGEA